MRRHPKPIRVSIITAAAALSILAVGPMTPIASARMPRKEVQIGFIEVECPVGSMGNIVGWVKEGTKKIVNGKSYVCLNGSWWLEQEEASRPPTNQERPSTPPVLAL